MISLLVLWGNFADDYRPQANGHEPLRFMIFDASTILWSLFGFAISAFLYRRVFTDRSVSNTLRFAIGLFFFLLVVLLFWALYLSDI
jgi:hypothetical protein